MSTLQQEQNREDKTNSEADEDVNNLKLCEISAPAYYEHSTKKQLDIKRKHMVQIVEMLEFANLVL